MNSIYKFYIFQTFLYFIIFNNKVYIKIAEFARLFGYSRTNSCYSRKFKFPLIKFKKLKMKNKNLIKNNNLTDFNGLLYILKKCKKSSDFKINFLSKLQTIVKQLQTINYNLKINKEINNLINFNLISFNEYLPSFQKFLLFNLIKKDKKSLLYKIL